MEDQQDEHLIQFVEVITTQIMQREYRVVRSHQKAFDDLTFDQ